MHSRGHSPARLNRVPLISSISRASYFLYIACLLFPLYRVPLISSKSRASYFLYIACLLFPLYRVPLISSLGNTGLLVRRATHRLLWRAALLWLSVGYAACFHCYSHIHTYIHTYTTTSIQRSSSSSSSSSSNTHTNTNTQRTCGRGALTMTWCSRILQVGCKLYFPVNHKDIDVQLRKWMTSTALPEQAGPIDLPGCR
jgi:hypothetical protein